MLRPHITITLLLTLSACDEGSDESAAGGLPDGVTDIGCDEDFSSGAAAWIAHDCQAVEFDGASASYEQSTDMISVRGELGGTSQPWTLELEWPLATGPGEIPCSADAVMLAYESGDSDLWFARYPTPGSSCTIQIDAQGGESGAMLSGSFSAVVVGSDGTEAEVYGGFNTAVE